MTMPFRNVVLEDFISKLEKCLKAGNDHEVRRAIQSLTLELRTKVLEKKPE